MNQISKIESTLNSFFSNKEISVLVLKGVWGIGKTYFWRDYIKEKIRRQELTQVAYAYVSLFGVRSLLELKSSIFSSAKILKSAEEVEKELRNSSENQNQVLAALLGVKSRGQNLFRRLGVISQLAKNSPKSKDFSFLINSFEYGLINNYLICIDDIERKESELSLRQLMGFVDELSTRKNCKIALILNEKTLSASDAEELKRYREKVVDLEIQYTPSLRDNLLKVFNGNEAFFEGMFKTLQTLSVSNIRIFKKLKWAIDKLWEFVDECEADFQEEIISHLTLFCWGFFNSESELSLAYISSSIKETTWLSISTNRPDNKDLTKEEKEWNQLASALSIFPKAYDEHLISLLENGFLDTEGFGRCVYELNLRERINTSQKKLHRAWDMYADSFDDNIEQLNTAIRAVLDSDLDKINLSDFSQAVDWLQECGDEVSEYVEKYVEIHAEELANTSPEEPFARRINNTLLQARIQRLREQTKVFTIDDVLDKIVEKQGWSQEDICFLSSLSQDEIYRWMMSHPERLLSKIRSGLFTFKNLSSGNSEESQRYQTIITNTTEVLKKIGKQNLLNKKRVENIYGVKVVEE